MSKSFKTLIKISKNEVDRQQKELADVQRQQDMIRLHMEQMQAQMVTEKKLVEDNYADHDIASSFAQFAVATNEKIGQATELIGQMEEKISAMRDDLRVAFAEQKKYEIVDAAAAKRRLDERNKKEAEKLDEIATNIFIRSGDNE